MGIVSKYVTIIAKHKGDIMTKIITNGHSRYNVCWYDLPAKEQEYFDYTGSRESSYVKYQNTWYDMSEFTRVDSRFQPYLHTQGWHGYHTDTFFSAIVCRYKPDDPELVVMGLWIAS